MLLQVPTKHHPSKGNKETIPYVPCMEFFKIVAFLLLACADHPNLVGSFSHLAGIWLLICSSQKHQPVFLMKLLFWGGGSKLAETM